MVKRLLKGSRVGPVPPAIAPLTFETFERLFSAKSPWNSRPVNPILGTYILANDVFQPIIQNGAYSTRVFKAQVTDPPMTLYPLVGATTINDVDARIGRNTVTIPHWPADIVPAVGADGHADIYDAAEGKVYSFFQLKFEAGQWRTNLVGWGPISGTGWPNPGHWYQGGRAVGVCSSVGCIRVHEFTDGDTMFRHALAMSLTYSSMSANPLYVFPATSADGDAQYTNFGQIPEGSLMMLPPTYTATGAELDNAFLVKVINTLKTYGAYVVDRNYGTPFAIYVENGGPPGWAFGGPPYSNIPTSFGEYSNTVRIQSALRRVISVDHWLDGNGNSMVELPRNLNLLSMRGEWRNVYYYLGQLDLGVFNTFTQSVEWTAEQINIVQQNGNGSNLLTLLWGTPAIGQLCKITCYATGGASMKFSLQGPTQLYSSGTMTNGMALTFNWPVDPATGLSATYGVVEAYSGNSAIAKSVGATLTTIDAL